MAKPKVRKKTKTAATKSRPKSASAGRASAVKRKNETKLHRDGSLWARGSTRGGVLDGYWEWFRKDGTIMRSGSLAMGRQTGEWTTYDKSGKVYKVTRMK